MPPPPQPLRPQVEIFLRAKHNRWCWAIFQTDHFKIPRKLAGAGAMEVKLELHERCRSLSTVPQLVWHAMTRRGHFLPCRASPRRKLMHTFSACILACQGTLVVNYPKGAPGKAHRQGFVLICIVAGEWSSWSRPAVERLLPRFLPCYSCGAWLRFA